MKRSFQNLIWSEKLDFLKNSTAPTREHHFWGSKVSKILSKLIKKGQRTTPKSDWNFDRILNPFFTDVGSILAPKIGLKWFQMWFKKRTQKTTEKTSKNSPKMVSKMEVPLVPGASFLSSFSGLSLDSVFQSAKGLPGTQNERFWLPKWAIKAPKMSLRSWKKEDQPSREHKRQMPYLSASTVMINIIGLQVQWLACIYFQSLTRLPHVQRSSMPLHSNGVCQISSTRSREIRKRSTCKATLVQTQSLASPDHSVQAQERS